MSKVEDSYTRMMRAMLDPARNGPRLFSIEPLKPGFFDRPGWVSEKFKVVLWCEHSRLPLHALNEPGDTSGVYEIDCPRLWVQRVSPWLKRMSVVLELVLPIAGAAPKVLLAAGTYDAIGKQLEFSAKVAEGALKAAKAGGDWLVGDGDDGPAESGRPIVAEDKALAEFHQWLTNQDATFGGLAAVRNRRDEILWVHQKFKGEGEYRPR